MKGLRVLLLACLVCAHSAASVNLEVPISELHLSDGRVLHLVAIKGYSSSSLMARWEGGAGTINYDLLPADVRQAVEERKGPAIPASPKAGVLTGAPAGASAAERSPVEFGRASSVRHILVGGISVNACVPVGLDDWTDAQIPEARVMRAAIVPPLQLVALFASKSTSLSVQFQTNADIEGQDVNDSQFLEVADTLDESMKGAMNSVVAEGLLDRAKKSAGDAYKSEVGQDLKMDFGKPVIFPTSSRSRRHITVPMLMKGSATVGGLPQEIMLVVTMSIVRVQGRLVNVYLYDRYLNNGSKETLIQRTEDYLATFWKLNPEA